MGDQDLENLREKLNQMNDWPNVYLFKFIVLDDEHKIKSITGLFNIKKDKISFKSSSKGKYQSISIERNVADANEVIDIYKKASSIQGVMAL